MLENFYTRYNIPEFVGHMEQLAKIRPLIAADGLERGNRLYEVSTGSGLQFIINADRGFDVSDFRYQGIPLHWRSPNGDVNSKYHGDGDQAWSRSFPGGLFVTCGLSQFGAPNEDCGQQLPLHGDISNLPAWNVNTRAGWHEESYKLEVSAEVRQSRLFGERLVLRRTYMTELGSNTLEIRDTVKNEGFQSTPHMMLYHFNLGFPLLSPSTRIHMNVNETEPRDSAAAAGLSSWNEFEEPRETYAEQVFVHDIVPHESGMASVKVINPELNIAFHLEYESGNLPYLYHWKMCEKGTYVLGIEPANCKGIRGRKEARNNGTLRLLEPGEETHYYLRLHINRLSEE